MADYPLVSDTGNLASGEASGDLFYLFGTAMRVGTAIGTININANENDITAASTSGVAMMAKSAGLLDATIDFSGIWPKATTMLGISSLVTFNAAIMKHVTAFTLDINFPEIDITSATGAAGTYRRYMSGGTGQWGGTITAMADNAAAPVIPASGAASAVTFKMAENGTDPTLTGNININRQSQVVRVGDRSVITYGYAGSGNLTQTAGSTFPGITAASGTIARPTWDLAGTGVANNEMVMTVATGRTYTAECFWTRLSLSWVMDAPVQVTGTLRVASDVTVA
jgi:hypothetical protein